MQKPQMSARKRNMLRLAKLYLLDTVNMLNNAIPLGSGRTTYRFELRPKTGIAVITATRKTKSSGIPQKVEQDTVMRLSLCASRGKRLQTSLREQHVALMDAEEAAQAVLLLAETRDEFRQAQTKVDQAEEALQAHLTKMRTLGATPVAKRYGIPALDKSVTH